MRVRKGVRLRAPAHIERMRLVHGVLTNCEGLARLSQQARLNEMGRKKAEETTMAVALAQPHRETVMDAYNRVVATPDSKRLGTALGRFCARHRPKPLAPWLEDAGAEYGEVVDRWKRAMGFLRYGASGGLGCPVEDENLQARREKAEMDKRKLDEVLVAAVGRPGPPMMEFVCFDDQDPPLHWTPKLVDCLLAVAKATGRNPRNIRDARFED
jgi:hypothetical protein